MKTVKRQRAATGMYLIELIVAIAMSGLLAVVLGTSLSANLSFSSGAQNQLIAADIAQELVDRFRDYPGQILPSTTWIPDGTYPVHVDSDDGVIVNPNFPAAVSPLIFDVTNLTFQTLTLSSRFRSGTASTINVALVTLPNGSSPPTDRSITITVQWQEKTALRTYTLTTIVDQWGIHAN